eukprot:scaffold18676_cov52-Phaeocystis_antarctica.AAC.4
MTEVQAYNANTTDATAKCGPIAEWDVSAITDMSELFMEEEEDASYGLYRYGVDDDASYSYGVDDDGLVFNADISNWDTSSVTNMYKMFGVRSFPSPASNLQSSPPLHAACTAVAFRLPPPSPRLAPHRMPSFRLSAVRVGVQPAAELRHLQSH